jgi:hypothetical protein
MPPNVPGHHEPAKRARGLLPHLKARPVNATAGWVEWRVATRAVVPVLPAVATWGWGAALPRMARPQRRRETFRRTRAKGHT